MRKRACSYLGRRRLGQVGQTHPDNHLTAALDLDLSVKAIEVGVDGVGREAEFLADRRLVQPVKYALDDL